MKKLLLFLSMAGILSSLQAQNTSESELKYDFYGFLRGDYYYDSRQSVASSENVFFLYPKDENIDDSGADLNNVPNAGFYTFNMRPGLKVSGLRVFNADVSAQAEADFAGASGISAIVRLRLAFMRMQWKNSNLLIGQDWHPFFQSLVPSLMSLNTGAPFQPFNRSPQIRYTYSLDKLQLSGAALFQYQYNSMGLEGKSNNPQKRAVRPELNAMLSYKDKSIEAGVGINFLRINPFHGINTQEGKNYRIDEMLDSKSLQAHLRYTSGLFQAGGKVTYGQNMSHMTMLGGYAASFTDYEYSINFTNLEQVSSWVNVSYGKTYKASLFGGYTKSLGASEPISDSRGNFYGEGLEIDQMGRLSANISYNVPHFMLGLEYEFTRAYYGDSSYFDLGQNSYVSGQDYTTGLYKTTHSVSNHRVMVVISYLFN